MSNDGLIPIYERPRRGPWFQFRDVVGFEWNRLTLPVRGLPGELEGLRVVHLSDLHVRGGWWRAYDELVRRVEECRPDLLLFTGDFIDDKDDARAALPVIRRLLPKLTARLGVYAILGNHDPALATPEIEATGVRLIDGGRAVLETDAATIELIGLPGISRYDLTPAYVAAIPPKLERAVRIVMSHYPDHVLRLRPLEADVVLAGHTHGGQVCFPGGRPIITHDRLPKQYAHGAHRAEGTWLVVSRGFGFASIPVRLFAPAEVVEITLVRAPG